jgi:hypothetical protein
MRIANKMFVGIFGKEGGDAGADGRIIQSISRKYGERRSTGLIWNRY